MLGFVDQLAHHGLDHSNIAIKNATQCPSNQSKPVVGGETDDEERDQGTGTAKEQNWLPSQTIRQSAPEHASQGLRESEGRDEDAREESSILIVADMEILNKLPSVGEDGGKSNWLSKSNQS
jgi:hypothetical protein